MQQVAFAVLLRFHGTFFICRKRQLYFIWYLFVVSRHGVFFCSKPHLFHWLFVLSLHDFLYLFKTAIMFRWLFVVSRHGVFFLFKTTFISLAFCPFTARFFVSVQNCNYVTLTFCRFTPRCFFSKLQLYFIWYLFVVSLHFFVCSISVLFKTM